MLKGIVWDNRLICKESYVYYSALSVRRFELNGEYFSYQLDTPHAIYYNFKKFLLGGGRIHG